MYIEFCQFAIFSMDTDPLFHFQTIADILTKLDMYIKHCQLIVRE